MSDRLCVSYFFFGSLTLTFDAGLGQQAGSQNRIERGGHGDDGQVLGADASVLSRHVRVQRITRLGHRPAQDAAIPWTNRVLVLQMRPQGVGRPVNFACNSLTRGHCQKMCPAGHGSANRFVIRYRIEDTGEDRSPGCASDPGNGGWPGPDHCCCCCCCGCRAGDVRGRGGSRLLRRRRRWVRPWILAGKVNGDSAG